MLLAFSRDGDTGGSDSSPVMGASGQAFGTAHINEIREIVGYGFAVALPGWYS